MSEKNLKKIKYSGYDDRQLIDLLQQRDLAAFDVIYDRYWSTLFNEAHKRVRDLALSEEIVQDVFTSLWDTIPQREIADLGAYLFSVMRFQVFSSYKRAERKQFITNKYQQIQGQIVGENTDQAFLEKDLVTFIKHWLLSLPEKRREIFRLRYLEGFSTKEISERMDVSQNTVQNHLGLSLSKLRLLLKKHFTLLLFIFLNY
ncbi:RNA polymerase sigma factor [Sphingobacterium sp. LRF_L2]|uniref:RNA polymerase sigma factor n=1 Tax=Sphingobacterium sp. LRF_L2 TaxID=3369421 RepID=UPI003F6413B3